ncbi:hypothetical protein [Lentisphaera araneosa]|nr:hypothetical protein [Lentisphaera araneosa]
MKYKFCVNAHFDKDLKSTVNSKLQILHSELCVLDLPHKGRFYKNFCDLDLFYEVCNIFDDLGFDKDGSQSNKYYYTSISLEYCDDDKYEFPFLSLSGNSWYDSDNNFNEIINEDLIMDVKNLGNFKNWQINLLANGDLSLLVKSRFIEMYKSNGLNGLRFKPVLIKSLTAKLQPSKSVYWAQFEDILDEKDFFRNHFSDKYNQPVPKYIKLEFEKMIENLDVFYVKSANEILFSQKFFRLLESNNLLIDLNRVSPWGIDYLAGKSGSSLKNFLIKHDRFDNDIELTYRRAIETIEARKKEFNQEVVEANKIAEAAKEKNQLEKRQKAINELFENNVQKSREINYFQADFDYLGWNPALDKVCDLTGQKGLCLRPWLSHYDESYKVDLSVDELKLLVDRNHPGDKFFYVHINAIEKGILKVQHEIDDEFGYYEDCLSEEILDKMNRTPPYEGEGRWYLESEGILPFVGIWRSGDIKEHIKDLNSQEEFISSIKFQSQLEPLTLESIDVKGRIFVFKDPVDQSFMGCFEYN